MSIRKISLWFLLILLLGLAGGAVALWHYITREAEPVLTPLSAEYSDAPQMPEKTHGIKLTPLELRGYDGQPLPVCIAERNPEEETTRQIALSTELASNPAPELRYVDYVLVAAEWDHGIRTALPLVEELTAAGLRCVVWEPRALNNARRYCTHGLRESRDVPLIIDALQQREPDRELTIIGLGRGFGAGMLLQAAAAEPRLRGLVSIDAYRSLRSSIQRLMPDTLLSSVTLALLDLRIKNCIGIESFDVAPVDSAANIPRSTPVLILNLEQDNPTRTLDDAIGIYRQLPSDCREVWTLRSPDDPPGAESRTCTYTHRSGKDIVRDTINIRLLPDIERAMPSIIRWMNDSMIPAIRAPRIPTPSIPTPGVAARP